MGLGNSRLGMRACCAGALLKPRLGILGLRVGTLETKAGAFGLCGFLDTLWRGDFSCPPRGAFEFRSVGNLMGPNGETLSWTLSHEPRDGGLGGLEGFHGTAVDLIEELS